MKKLSFQIGTLVGLALMGMTATSCLDNEDPYNAGFVFVKPASPYTYLFANNTEDSLVMQCLGPWEITQSSGSSWCKVERTSGKGNATYSLRVDFEPNTTGKSRQVQFSIRDTDHPDKAYSSWLYTQYATRGDGTLGNAALVKGITSSDGWNASIEYDAKARPVKYELRNPEGSLSDQLTVAYDERNLQVTVSRGGATMVGAMNGDYQPVELTGATDTIGYASQYYSNGMPVSATNAFKFVATSNTRGTQLFSYLLNGQSLLPDSLHKADSIRYMRRWKGEATDYIVKLKMEYGSQDNRCQSLDVNQLLLGFAECHPMQLLSMFRYTRSTSIVARALTAEGDINVTTELNADKSVSRMTVKDARKGTEVVYDFTY